MEGLTFFCHLHSSPEHLHGLSVDEATVMVHFEDSFSFLRTSSCKATSPLLAGWPGLTAMPCPGPVHLS